MVVGQSQEKLVGSHNRHQSNDSELKSNSHPPYRQCDFAMPPQPISAKYQYISLILYIDICKKKKKKGIESPGEELVPTVSDE